MIRTAVAAMMFVASTNAQFDLERSNEGSISDLFTTSGNVEFSSEQVWDGDSSVKFSSNGFGYNRNFLSFDLSSTDLGDEMYGSMMVWVDGNFGQGAGDFTFVQADGSSKDSSSAPSGTTVSYRYRASGDFFHNGTVFANYDTWIDNNGDGQTDHLTDCWDHPQGGDVQLPRETWTCLEWHFDADDNTLEYWLNGDQLAIFISGDGPHGDGCVGGVQGNEWTGPESFSTLHLGVEQYHGYATPRTFFIDSLSVDSERLGCPSRS